MYNFDASSKCTTIIQCHLRHVEKVHNTPKITLKYNSIFRRHVIYTYIPFKFFRGADWTRPKYSCLFSTRQKYVRLFWTRPKSEILSGKSA